MLHGESLPVYSMVSLRNVLVTLQTGKRSVASMRGPAPKNANSQIARRSSHGRCGK
jgi:hypothetical protein